MGFKKFSAKQIFDGYKLHENKVLVTDDSGHFEALIPDKDAGGDVQNLDGIITPGLINCHCHLELSHLKNVIPPHIGLIEFLCSVVTKREALSTFPPKGETLEDPIKMKLQAIVNAEKEMYDNGIVAVGDIGNTADTAEIKSKSKIHWQNFVEILSFTDEKADENIAHFQSIAKILDTELKHSNISHRTSIVPHAPYSISPKTFQLINQLTKNQVISIHNQEHPAENDLYQTGGGEYLKLFKIFGLDHSPFPVTGKNSIQSVLPYFNNGQTIFLVHNTSMKEEDIIWANEHAETTGIKLVYCLCINANLYIENKVPPTNLLIKHNCHIVLGTDSYSSNWQLSIAKEIEAIHKHFPHIPLETILQWATSNGAKALQWENELGSFEKGRKSGITLIKHNQGISQRLT